MTAIRIAERMRLKTIQIVLGTEDSQLKHQASGLYISPLAALQTSKQFYLAGLGYGARK